MPRSPAAFKYSDQIQSNQINSPTRSGSRPQGAACPSGHCGKDGAAKTTRALQAKHSRPLIALWSSRPYSLAAASTTASACAISVPVIADESSGCRRPACFARVDMRFEDHEFARSSKSILTLVAGLKETKQERGFRAARRFCSTSQAHGVLSLACVLLAAFKQQRLHLVTLPLGDAAPSIDRLLPLLPLLPRTRRCSPAPSPAFARPLPIHHQAPAPCPCANSGR